MTDDDRVPVTLLTGFLGAGKTTLLNALLQDASAGRVAVVVNEFGEAGLDHDLIDVPRDAISLMQSGCLCCTLKGALSDTLSELLTQRDWGGLAFDRIVIETTGLADPGPILQTLVMDDALAKTTRMDGVVTVADAVNGAQTLDAQFEAVSQAAMADLIVISKTDLATPQGLGAFEARLKGLNPSAQMLHAVRGDGVAGQFFGLSALRHGVTPAKARAWASQPADPLDNLSGLAAASAEPATLAPHDGRITSASITIDTPINSHVFERWIENLSQTRGDQILRMKGVVFLEDVNMPFVFHGVQRVFDRPVPLETWSGEDRKSRIVLIARDVSESHLKRDLKQLCA